jgi:transposase-like protein
MAHPILNEFRFHNEQAAFDYVEAHLWPNGPTCPHCGNVDPAKIGRLQGKTSRVGLRKCYACRETFTVRMGTIFEDSHLALHLWLQVIHLLNASKKGIATRQVQRLLQCSMKTAWFLTHRIREIMKDDASPMGGSSPVEIDETFIGGKTKNRHQHQRGRGLGWDIPKTPVLALVERNGRARAVHVPKVTGANLAQAVDRNVVAGSTIYSDENPVTRYAARPYKTASVNHKDGEYVKGDVHTNTVEGFFAILKRGITGVYHGVSEAHLQRYLTEFGHRYSHREALGVDDVTRAAITVKGAKGKRLTYQSVSGARGA